MKKSKQQWVEERWVSQYVGLAYSMDQHVKFEGRRVSSVTFSYDGLAIVVFKGAKNGKDYPRDVFMQEMRLDGVLPVPDESREKLELDYDEHQLEQLTWTAQRRKEHLLSYVEKVLDNLERAKRDIERERATIEADVTDTDAVGEIIDTVTEIADRSNLKYLVRDWHEWVSLEKEVERLGTCSIEER